MFSRNQQLPTMLRHCHGHDQSFTFQTSTFFGVRIGIWAIFGLFLEAFLNLAHLYLISFSSFQNLPASFFVSSKIPEFGTTFKVVVLALPILQIISLPFGFIGFLILNPRIFFLSTIFTIFQTLAYLCFGVLAFLYHTETSTRPMEFLGIQLLLSTPIHLFCSVIFMRFVNFAQFYAESILYDFEFTCLVEQNYLAQKKQRMNMYRYGNRRAAKSSSNSKR